MSDDGGAASGVGDLRTSSMALSSGRRSVTSSPHSDPDSALPAALTMWNTAASTIFLLVFHALRRNISERNFLGTGFGVVARGDGAPE